MKKHLMLAVVLAVGVLALPRDGRAQPCVGDCDGDGTVAINEVITCVNIGLELLPLANCTACDGNGDGAVAINEIITSVNIGLGLLPCGGGVTPTIGPPTPTHTPVPGEAICGNGVMEAGEECDDGNNWGGDGCAKNCTNETPRRVFFEDRLTVPAAMRSRATVQTGALPVAVRLSGSQVYTTGTARNEVVRDPAGNVITNPGEIPVVVPEDQIAFDPVSVPGLVCACVRGVIAEEFFGPGNAGDGVIGCGDVGIENINYHLRQDHNTTPGSPGNSGSARGLPDDPECDDTFTFDVGLVSPACIEGEGEICNEPEFIHHGACTNGFCAGGNIGRQCTSDTACGVCNSPRNIEFFGGPTPRGSALINYNIGISLLQDAGICQQRFRDDGTCRFPQYGPDCLPCTDDDLVFDPPELLPQTTGTAQGTLFDSNNTAGELITEGVFCPPPTPPLESRLCVTKVEGLTFDCELLLSDPTGGFAGVGLATAYPAIDSAQIGDNVTSAVFFYK
jgi:cysteine-rich repeat protein